MANPQSLNQQAIDHLFLVEHEGETPAPSAAGVQAYNFLRPSRLGGQARLSIESAQEAFAVKLGKILAMQLRSSVEVKVQGIENVFFSEFGVSLGSPCAAFLVPVGGRGAVGVLDWGADSALAFVDRVLGGTGHVPETLRPLTRIEQGLVSIVTRAALPALAGAWADVVTIGTEPMGYESTLNGVNLARPEERMLTTLFDVDCGSFRGTLTVGLPFAEVEQAVQHAPPVTAEVTSPVERAGPGISATNLPHSRLSVSVQMPPIRLTLREVAGLQEGQILHTTLPRDTPIHVNVNGRLLFHGSLGEVRSHLGVRVSDPADSPGPSSAHHAKRGRIL